MSVKDTICDLKWNYPIFNLNRGEFRSCCRTPAKIISETDINERGIDAFLNSDSLKESRLALLNGEQHQDCESCWNLEKAGIESPRHKPIKFWDHLKRSRKIPHGAQFSDDALLEFVQTTDSHTLLDSRNPYMMEVSLGNICDLKCMYCNHHYSSQWSAEMLKWGDISQSQLDSEFPKAPDNFNPAFWNWFNDIGRYSLSKIGIIGGEPLITPEFYPFLDKLISSVAATRHKRRNKITLSIVSNFNTSPNYFEKFLSFLPMLNDNFNVELYASMESIGQRAEYIRYGLKWDRFCDNIDKILKFQKENSGKIKFSFMSSVNILSVVSTVDFLKFVESLSRKHEIPIGIIRNIISFPKWQSPYILTPDFCSYLDKAIEYIDSVDDIPIDYSAENNWKDYKFFLQSLSEAIRTETKDATMTRRKFADWFNTYDHRRKLNLSAIFPEYVNFFNYCSSL
jgi:hypothetical protein